MSKPTVRIEWTKNETEKILARVRANRKKLVRQYTASIQRIAAWFEDRKYPLPMSGQRITHNHVAAFAAVTYFEGEVRPLAQIRRRASRAKPPRYAPLPPDPGAS